MVYTGGQSDPGPAKRRIKKMIKKPSRGFPLFLLSSLVSAQAFCLPQLSVHISPEAWIPLGNSSGIIKDGKDLDLYSVGYGLDLCADMSFFGFFSPFLEAGVNSIPLNNVAGKSLLYGTGGGGLSVYAFPIPRLLGRGSVSAGLGYASIPRTSLGEALSGMAPYWKAKAELGYRFSPSFSILGNAGYSQLLGSEVPIFKGLSAGLVFNIGLDKLGGGSAGLAAEVLSQETIFPIVYYKSEKKPIATLVLTNRESAEIRDVRVSFSAGAYSSRAAECGSYPIILHNASVEVPIYANFNDKVLGFTETTKIQGDIRVEYRILDSARSASKAVSLLFNNRNQATWADPRVAAAFISPQDPVMLELSKYIAGLVRVHSRPEIDKFLQYGMGIFEGLRVYGLVWTPDPAIPYSVARADTGELAYLQYPYQTLSYKSGDSDALALAVAEALESIAVPAALAVLPEDVIVAFPLDMGEAQARTSFGNLGDFIFDAGKVWVPLRASMMRDGFLRSWRAGAELWKAQAGTRPPELIKVEEAWKEFSPLALADVDYRPTKPSEEAVTLAFENVLGRFVAVEVEPKAARILQAMQGEGTGKQRNSLGIVYAQYGLYAEARAEFEKAVARDYAPALVNLANVAFLLKDYETAAACFEKALAAQPSNKAALIGLARARYELDAYAQADELFARVRALDPALAERYAYLSSKVEAGLALRASSAAADRGGGMSWDQEE
jgi:tetratricopeptide (TPR) repeat protein